MICWCWKWQLGWNASRAWSITSGFQWMEDGTAPPWLAENGVKKASGVVTDWLLWSRLLRLTWLIVDRCELRSFQPQVASKDLSTQEQTLAPAQILYIIHHECTIQHVAPPCKPNSITMTKKIKPWLQLLLLIQLSCFQLYKMGVYEVAAELLAGTVELKSHRGLYCKVRKWQGHWVHHLVPWWFLHAKCRVYCPPNLRKLFLNPERYKYYIFHGTLWRTILTCFKKIFYNPVTTQKYGSKSKVPNINGTVDRTDKNSHPLFADFRDGINFLVSTSDHCEYRAKLTKHFDKY